MAPINREKWSEEQKSREEEILCRIPYLDKILRGEEVDETLFSEVSGLVKRMRSRERTKKSSIVEEAWLKIRDIRRKEKEYKMLIEHIDEHSDEMDVAEIHKAEILFQALGEEEFRTRASRVQSVYKDMKESIRKWMEEREVIRSFPSFSARDYHLFQRCVENGTHVCDDLTIAEYKSEQENTLSEIRNSLHSFFTETESPWLSPGEATEKVLNALLSPEPFTQERLREWPSRHTCIEKIYTLMTSKTENSQNVNDSLEFTRKQQEELQSSCKEVSDLFLSLIFSFPPPGKGKNRSDCRSARELLKGYVKGLPDITKPHPAFFLALARILDPSTKKNLYLRCLRMCVPLFQDWLMPMEREYLAGREPTAVAPQALHSVDEDNTAPTANPPEEISEAQDFILGNKWKAIKKGGSWASSVLMAGDALLHNVYGCKEVKEEALDVLQLIREKKDDKGFHCCLYGKSGTGLTMIGEILADLWDRSVAETSLEEESVSKGMGLKKGENAEMIKQGTYFTTGKHLLSKGFESVLNKVKEGGCLFIDNAEVLLISDSEEKGNKHDPEDVLDALRRTLRTAQLRKTIIIAVKVDGGATKETEYEKKLRKLKAECKYVFPLRDYNVDDLVNMFCTNSYNFTDIIVKSALKIQFEEMMERIPGGNGYHVERLRCSVRARVGKTNPEKSETSIPLTVADILGPPPNSIPQVKAVFSELDEMIGQDIVKRRMKTFLDTATMNYHKKCLGRKPDPIKLNQVFVGNPGTGKTTVAKLYARLLQHLGYLLSEDGELSDKEMVVVKNSDSFIGSHVGQSGPKTRRAIESCAGRVLVIDEAYDLKQSDYGPEAVNMMVSILNGDTSSDNLAVVLCGYEKEMKELMKMNDGLARRFDDDLFHFTDYSEEDFTLRLKKMLEEKDIYAHPNVINQMLHIIGEVKEEQGTSFGNMGTVESLFNKWNRNRELRILREENTSKELLREDVRRAA